MRFTKMEALANDFMVVDGINQHFQPDAQAVQGLADRRRGVGFDQLLVAERPAHLAADVRYRIYNADGAEVEHCGNGVRCLARFLLDEGLVAPGRLRIETAGRITEADPLPDGRVTIDMGAPELDPAQVPFQASSQQDCYTLRTRQGDLRVGAVSMGNPHAVLLVASTASAPVDRLGPEIESHARFPQGANVGFMEVLDREHIRLRVHERGVGETPACGTGACAAVVTGRLWDWLDPTVVAELPGGRLVIHWRGPGRSVWMTGPARAVFRGEIDLPPLAPGIARGNARLTERMERP